MLGSLLQKGAGCLSPFPGRQGPCLEAPFPPCLRTQVSSPSPGSRVDGVGWGFAFPEYPVQGRAAPAGRGEGGWLGQRPSGAGSGGLSGRGDQPKRPGTSHPAPAPPRGAAVSVAPPPSAPPPTTSTQAGRVGRHKRWSWGEPAGFSAVVPWSSRAPSSEVQRLHPLCTRHHARDRAHPGGPVWQPDRCQGGCIPGEEAGQGRWAPRVRARAGAGAGTEGASWGRLEGGGRGASGSRGYPHSLAAQFRCGGERAQEATPPAAMRAATQLYVP